MQWKITLQDSKEGAFAPLPKDLLEKLGVKAGDELAIEETKTGLLVTVAGPGFDEQMKIVDRVAKRYYKALSTLAKS